MPSIAKRDLVPDDLYRLRVPTDPRLAPDGRSIVCKVKASSPAHDGYRSAIWRVALDPSGAASGEPERLTIGVRNDGRGRFAPDGRTLAFLSDRRKVVEEELGGPRDREDASQVHLLPLDRPGEARRLTNLPRGVDDFAWSPDGTRLAVISSSRGADRATDDRLRRRLRDPGPDKPPMSDYWFFDRLGYQLNGAGVISVRTPHLWVVDVATGDARRLTDLASGVSGPAWSPDGGRIAVTAGRTRDHDLSSDTRVVVVDVATGAQTPVAARRNAYFLAAVWLGRGADLAVLGGDMPHAGYRTDIWVFSADGSDPAGGRNVSGRHDIMPSSSMNSDVTVGDDSRLIPTLDGRGVYFMAPISGSYEVWRLDLERGDLEQVTHGQHYVSGFDVLEGPDRGVLIGALRSTPSTFPELHTARIAKAGGSGPGRAGRGRTRATTSSASELVAVSNFNADLAGEVQQRPAVERSLTVDGRPIQGWLISAGPGKRPVVVQIHGGPHTLYGWAPFLEFQVLAAAGISVFYCNPRGSEGYGLAFNEANLADWGDGPMQDVIAGVDALVHDGLADPDRLGVTGGSYGGYLTNWIIAHDQRFRAALAARSVTDMSMLMLTGDLGGTDWAKMELGAYPWEDPELFRRLSPLTYAANIRTPLLLQHAEHDLRTTIGQAEALFSVLRRHRRPVRMMRVPGESHELTRSGTPFRRAENLVQVRDWFAHFLVAGKRTLPRAPRTRHGD